MYRSPLSTGIDSISVNRTTVCYLKHIFKYSNGEVVKIQWSGIKAIKYVR